MRRSIVTLMTALAVTAALSTAGGALAEAPAPAAPPTCGAKGLPDCPLQAWMKGQLQAQLRTQDFGRMAKALDLLAEKAPKGYQGWAESARAGATAARAGDMAGVRASCKTCHDAQRVQWREGMRAAQLF